MFATLVVHALMVALTTATKIDRPYCNTQMNTGVIPPLPTNATLLQVHILHRHGSRTKDAASPTEIWLGESKVIYNCTTQLLEGPDASVSPSGAVLFNKVYLSGRNELNGNCMTGQLVSKGLEMCQASGRHLAQAYKDFLPNNYEDFYLRSDDVPRTLASGQALFAAMYPEGGDVVPWHTMDINSDAETMVPNPKVCPNLVGARSSALSRFQASKHYQFVSTPLARELSNAINRTILPLEIADLLDPLMSVQCSTVPSSGGTVPKTFTSNLQDRMIEEAAYKLYFGCNDTDVAKFGAGPLLGEILVKMERALGQNEKENENDNEKAVKMAIWSGHDTGPMSPVIGALGVGGSEFPRFNDLLAIELYSSTSTTSTSSAGAMVRVVHNGEVVTDLVPGCSDSVDSVHDGLCSWVHFHQTVMNMVPTPSECGRVDSPDWWPVPTAQQQQQ